MSEDNWVTIEELEERVKQLERALAACIDLIEAWAYGPLFEKAAIKWPMGVCQAPALIEAKRLLT